MCNNNCCWNSIFKHRHSLSHILAQSVQRQFWSKIKLWVWPAIDDWFYYDIQFPDGLAFQEADLKVVQKHMENIVKQKQEFVCFWLDYNNAKELNIFLWQEFKNELVEEFFKEWENEFLFYFNIIQNQAKDALLKWVNDDYILYYDKITSLLFDKWVISDDKYVTFIDMCEWPHVSNTSEIDVKSFKLAKIAWAYRRWSEKNPMMTRIYWYAFNNVSELKAHLEFLEEAKKRDHRVLWKKLKLFTTSDLVWAWLPLLQPNWMTIRKVLEDYLWDLHKDKWYQRVRTPHIAKKELYETSWHWQKFWDELMKIEWKYENFCVKPMNCPHHMQIFADNQFSYRDMPVRYFEPATIYRDEKPWQLWWLLRVRSITQDDWHLFCRVEQLSDEISTIVDIIKTFYSRMWMMNNYWVSLSVRWDDKSAYIWDESAWVAAEWALENAAIMKSLNFKKVEWEAAFYWPKLDFMFKDCLWREWQLATIQLDFQLPERFKLEFTNENWDKERPVVIHRAICWSLERFMWIMIEHFAGSFPFWLAPHQALVIPVSDKFSEYALEVSNRLKTSWYRVSVDNSPDSFNRKIRNWETRKIPYLLIVWEKEENDWTVSIRDVYSKNQDVLSIEQLLRLFQDISE